MTFASPRFDPDLAAPMGDVCHISDKPARPLFLGSPSELRDATRAAGLDFGRCLRRWRVAQGWAQDTAETWGKAAEIPHVYASSWSELETGKAVNPGPRVFRSLGIQNRRLATGEYGRVLDRGLLDRIKAAKPIVDENGRPWDGSAFYGAFVGERQFPEEFRRELPNLAPIHEALAAEWAEAYRDRFRKLAGKANLSPVAALAGVTAEAPKAERETLEALLFGFASYSAADLEKLRSETGELAPAAWLAAWESKLEAPPLRLPPPLRRLLFRAEASA